MGHLSLLSLKVSKIDHCIFHTGHHAIDKLTEGKGKLTEG